MKNSKKLRKSQLDGLNNVQYDLVNIEKNNLFVRFYVSYNKTMIANLNLNSTNSKTNSNQMNEPPERSGITSEVLTQSKLPKAAFKFFSFVKTSNAKIA